MIQLFPTHGERGDDPCEGDPERVNEFNARRDAVNNYSKESSLSLSSASNHSRDSSELK